LGGDSKPTSSAVVPVTEMGGDMGPRENGELWGVGIVDLLLDISTIGGLQPYTCEIQREGLKVFQGGQKRENKIKVLEAHWEEIHNFRISTSAFQNQLDHKLLSQYKSKVRKISHSQLV
jgi:hypothetical protein